MVGIVQSERGSWRGNAWLLGLKRRAERVEGGPSVAARFSCLGLKVSSFG